MVQRGGKQVGEKRSTEQCRVGVLPEATSDGEMGSLQMDTAT
jgi:hypothetical protein